MTPPVKERARIPVSGGCHEPPPGAILAWPTSPGTRIDVTLVVKRRAELNCTVRPETPACGEDACLTRATLLHAHGADPDSLVRIRDFAQASGLTILREWPRASRVTVSGSANDLALAFGVRLFDFDHVELGRFHACVGDVSVPAPLRVGDIGAVFGLDNHRAVQQVTPPVRPALDPSGPEPESVVDLSTFDEKGMIDGLAAVIEDNERKVPGRLYLNWELARSESSASAQASGSSPAARYVDESLCVLARMGVTVCAP